MEGGWWVCVALPHLRPLPQTSNNLDPYTRDPYNHQVLEHEAIKRLTRKVKLRAPPSSSRFWRYHSKGDGHLSSVEGR